jgi:hypothetical protein
MILRPLFLIVVCCAALSCEDRCNRGNLMDIEPPTPIQSFEVRDEHQVLWQITSTVPREIGYLRYGEVPSGFQQVIPNGSAHPRPFVKDETLHTKTISQDRVFEHDGYAGSESSFCGGYYQTYPRTKS